MLNANSIRVPQLFQKFSFASPSAGLLTHKTQPSKEKVVGNEIQG